MKSWKWKILLPIILISLLFIAKYILWNFPISSGKRVGNLTKISKKGKIIPTWEGTIDEGSGDQLTSTFSIKDNVLAEELYNYEGRQVILYYEQYILGWPRETSYNITSWKPKADLIQTINNTDTNTNVGSSSKDSDYKALDILSKTLFCSLLGSLISDQDLYIKVKEHVRKNNLYLFNQFDACNN